MCTGITECITEFFISFFVVGKGHCLPPANLRVSTEHPKFCIVTGNYDGSRVSLNGRQCLPGKTFVAMVTTMEGGVTAY